MDDSHANQGAGYDSTIINDLGRPRQVERPVINLRLLGGLPTFVEVAGTGEEGPE